ncbi:response regulator receiver protein [Stanieria cyanosphaera PCC 7437]|uniref:Response regulator receiver protein n=1 Tax=Stanieria cyanosphaera (strain ATCC 29371 / PCC 7437) TaxID=111780 RepID=K9Y1S4_STAC7|nr:response regulator transcription factor [Stanieria cyanosphaera]AFZ37942.1 response regulator receiver protein [Stanieria cyanosphaera PCC 7437]
MNQAIIKILVIDDHETVLNGTIDALEQQYPNAVIDRAKTKQEATLQLNSFNYDLAIVDLVIPESYEQLPQSEVGIELLRTLFQKYPNLNIVVQSIEPERLILLKSAIDEHQGGFCVANKSLTLQQMLTRVNLALQGECWTPRELRPRSLELREDWLTAIAFKFEEGLDDPTIAKKMHRSESTVRHYWTKIRDAIEVYPETGKDLKIQTLLKLIEIGIISY